jgi:hypothetical protein
MPEEFDPMRGAHRAPETSSTHEAISVSMGPIAQRIHEATLEGRVGFCNGWISLNMVKQIFTKTSPQKLSQIIEEMGYRTPVVFGDSGRPNHPTMADGVKSKLFLINGHELHNSEFSSAQMAQMYDNGQINHKI